MWVVRAEAAPFTCVIQHDDGLVVIKEAPPRPAQPRQTSKWVPHDGTNSSAVKFPASWADIAQGTKRKQGVSESAPPARAPAFTKGKDLNIQEVTAADPRRGNQSAAAGGSQGSEQSIPTDALLLGRIEEMLRGMSTLTSRVDALAGEVAVMRGSAEDTVLMDVSGGRENARTSRSPRGRQQRRLHIR